MGDWIAGWRKDLRQAVRGLFRSPGFAAVAVLTLALGMGGSAAIYTLLDRIVLDPLPYPDSERLVELTNQVPGVGPDEVWAMSTAQYVYFTEHARSFDAIALYRGLGANIQTPEGPHRAFGWRVTASVFPILGARARIGRLIEVEDDRPGGPSVVVLSHGFWQRQFGGDQDVLGELIRINDFAFEIIGVLEPGVRIPDSPAGLSADLWIPMQIDPSGFFGNNHVFPMIARLERGADPEAAERELTSLTPQLPERFPNAYSQEFFDRYGFRTQVTPLKQAVVGEVSRNLWILFGAVALVLVIACANVANLFLVRMEGRRRELAIRSALGAGRAAVARHVLAEGLALSLAGASLGIVLAFWGVPTLTALAPETLPRIADVGIDLGTVGYMALLALLVALGLAAYPLVWHTETADVGSLAGAGRSESAGPDRQRLRSALVVTQVALALTLIVGAGLLVESLRRLRAVESGVRPEGVVTAGLHLTPGRYDSDVEIWATYAEILERVRAIPGVTAAGMTAELPVTGDFGCTIQGFEEQAVYERVRDAGMTTCAGQEPTTPGYFEAMGIPVLQGRTFTQADNDVPTRGAVVVSRAFADRFWPGEDPIGKGVGPSGRTVTPFYRVIGVVGDVPAGSLDSEPATAIYYPIVHNPATSGNWDWWRPTNLDLVVRTELADPLSIFPAMRRAVQAVDPTAPLTNARSMERIIADSTARLTFIFALLSIAAAVALTLAAVGLYGVISYVVTRRTWEIGVRIAIGARPDDVERFFVKRSLFLVGVGLIAGA
ncbi:MAG: ABC transporter permease, partial [Planctomycetota bacterium]